MIFGSYRTSSAYGSRIEDLKLHDGNYPFFSFLSIDPLYFCLSLVLIFFSSSFFTATRYIVFKLGHRNRTCFKAGGGGGGGGDNVDYPF